MRWYDPGDGGELLFYRMLGNKTCLQSWPPNPMLAQFPSMLLSQPSSALCISVILIGGLRTESRFFIANEYRYLFAILINSYYSITNNTSTPNTTFSIKLKPIGKTPGPYSAYTSLSPSSPSPLIGNLQIDLPIVSWTKSHCPEGSTLFSFVNPIPVRLLRTLYYQLVLLHRLPHPF